jgi:molybdopterin-guanine dinucleotide biosynthesis protein B
MRVFAVSGFSGTGKTAVVETLVRALRERGSSVATVKSSKEDIGAPEGTDTWKHEKAGADPTVLVGPHSTTLRLRSRQKIRATLLGHDTDFLLIEGMKEENMPKFWCVGNGPFRPRDIPPSAMAVVAWDTSAVDATKVKIPVIRATDTEKLLEIVLREAVDISKLDI